MEDNEKIFSTLVVSNSLDLRLYDDREINKEVFKRFLEDKDCKIWNLKETIDLVNKLCRIENLDRDKLLTFFIYKELKDNSPLYTRSVYNTLYFKIKDYNIENDIEIHRINLRNRLLYIYGSLDKMLMEIISKYIEKTIRCFWHEFGSSILGYKTDIRYKHVVKYKNKEKPEIYYLDKIENIINIRDIRDLRDFDVMI